MCKGSAFLDKSNNLYLKWQGNVSDNYSYSAQYFNLTSCEDHSSNSNSASNSSFDSDGKCNANYSSSNYHSYFCCECDCPANEGGSSGSTIGDEKSTTSTWNVGQPTEDPEGEGCDNLGGYSGSSTGPGISCPPTPFEQEINESSSTSTEESNITTSRFLKATVTWSTSATLYDGNGDPVADPWSMLPAPGAYDPLNPLRIVNAPGCYFFST
jgi:hypothetical protein